MRRVFTVCLLGTASLLLSATSLRACEPQTECCITSSCCTSVPVACGTGTCTCSYTCGAGVATCGCQCIQGGDTSGGPRPVDLQLSIDVLDLFGTRVSGGTLTMRALIVQLQNATNWEVKAKTAVLDYKTQGTWEGTFGSTLQDIAGAYGVDVVIDDVNKVIMFQPLP